MKENSLLITSIFWRLYDVSIIMIYIKVPNIIIYIKKLICNNLLYNETAKSAPKYLFRKPARRNNLPGL